MRPISLTMAAFGPFSGTEKIHFDELGENPLFLINGPTGSGKTTILDGICFALYGKTTGDEREASQMRCDIAAPGQLTYVELVFALGDKTWRIRREPDQQRPNSRGEGTTAHRPRAELYRRKLDGTESVLVASKISEARVAVEEMIGLNVDQFRQVMVLPQGEFRKLLVAKSSEREKVFSHLFQTRIYSRIEQSLKEQASGVRKRLEASRNQQLGILRGVEFDNEGELELALRSQGIVHGQHAERKKQAEIRKQGTDQALILANKSAADFTRLEENRANLEVLRKQEAQVEQARASLLRAQTALRFLPDYQRKARATEACSLAKQKLTTAQTALRLANEQHAQLQKNLEGVLAEGTEAEQLENTLRQLIGYRERVKQLESASRKLETSVEAQARSEQAIQQARNAFEQDEQHFTVLEQRYQEMADRLRKNAELPLEVKRLSELLEAYKSCEQLKRELEKVAITMAEKADQRERTQLRLDKGLAKADRLEYAWHAGQAVLLAEKLESGQACPVCGSKQHPVPASSTVAIPSQEQREQAAADIAAARRQLADLDRDVTRLETDLSYTRQQIEGYRLKLGEVEDQSFDTLEQLHATRRQALLEFQKDQDQVGELSERLKVASVQLENTRVSTRGHETDFAQTSIRLEIARSELRRAEQELPETWRAAGRLESEISGLECRIAEYQDRKEACTQAAEQSGLVLRGVETDLQHAINNRDQLSEDAGVALTAWQARLSDSPFLGERDFTQSLLDEKQVADIQARVDAHTEALDRARGAVASLEKTLENRQRPDLQALKQQAELAVEVWAEAQRSFLLVDRQHSALLNAQQKLGLLKNQYRALEDQYSLVGTLADTASGKIGERISLQRFVLSVMLDDVLLVASERLKRMSRGRYTLYRQREKARGGSASGLDLLVDDAYYGTQRPVVTLSGGESFMAALSLALALSDVVQSRSGGIRLDTLFIDEGFGSLDSESLELAVNTLVELRASGRMVGVISHVPELKEWIKVRLDVVSSRTGSLTRTVVG